MANAEDALAGWLAHAEHGFIKKPSKHAIDNRGTLTSTCMILEVIPGILRIL